MMPEYLLLHFLFSLVFFFSFAIKRCIQAYIGRGACPLKKNQKQFSKMNINLCWAGTRVCLLFPLTDVNLFLHFKNKVVVYLVWKLLLCPRSLQPHRKAARSIMSLLMYHCALNDVHLQQSGIQCSEQWQPKQHWKDASQFAEFPKHVLMNFCLQRRVGDNLHSLHI